MQRQPNANGKSISTFLLQKLCRTTFEEKRVKFEVAMKKFYPYQQPQQQQQPQCKSSFYFCIFAFETVFKRFPNYTVWPGDNAIKLFFFEEIWKI